MYFRISRAVNAHRFNVFVYKCMCDCFECVDVTVFLFMSLIVAQLFKNLI